MDSDEEHNKKLEKLTEKIEELSEEFNQDPKSFVIDLFECLSFPPGFKEEARKSSFKTALSRALHGSLFARKLEEEVYAILGKHDYHIDDGEIDLENRTCWFRMYFSDDEKKIDLTSLHFELEEGSSAIILLERILEDFSNWENFEAAQAAAKEETQNHFDDPRELELEFSEGYDDNSVDMMLTIEDEEVSYLPKLTEINKAMDEMEYKFRKALEQK